jgi:[ribosomal protein S5]-alanine N-acetyltransferase
MKLESERLMLRPLVESDATQMYADWLNDPEVNQYLETRHSPQSVETCREFIGKTNHDPNSHLFGIFLKEGGQHIGNTKLGFINPHYRSAEYSLFIGDRASWGKGLMTEVTRTLATYGFQTLGLERIESGCYEGNLASMRVLLKTGFTVEGFFRKSVVSNGRRCGFFWLGILKDELV